MRRAELDFVKAVLFVKSDLAFKLELGLVDPLQKLFERFFLLEFRLFVEPALRQHCDKAGIAQPPAELSGERVVLLHVQQERRQPRSLESHAFFGLHDVIFGCAFHQFTGEITLVANVFLAFPALHAIERRLGDEDVLAVDQLLHVAEEKRQQQRADVRPVDVRVGHQDDFVVAQLAGVKIVLADAGAERGDDGANFFVPQHLVVARFLDVEDFSFERQDGLVFAVAALLRRAARRFALDHKQFAARRIAFLAVRQLSRQPARIHRGLAPRQFPGLACRLARARRVNALADDAPGHGRMLVKPLAELFVHELLDIALDVAVELALGLPFKLRLRQPHADHGNQSFPHVVAGDGDFVLGILEHAGLRSEIVDRPRKRRAEPGKMRAAVHGIDGVREREHVFAIGVVVL